METGLSHGSKADPALGAAEHPNGIAGADLTLLENPEVGAESSDGQEALREAGIVQAHAKLETRKPRLGDLQQGRPDPPPIPDPCRAEVEYR